MSAPCGTKICAWCKAPMGDVPGLAPGKVSHGCCPKCCRELLADIRALPFVEPTNRRLPPSEDIDKECET